MILLQNQRRYISIEATAAAADEDATFTLK